MKVKGENERGTICCFPPGENERQKAEGRRERKREREERGRLKSKQKCKQEKRSKKASKQKEVLKMYHNSKKLGPEKPRDTLASSSRCTEYMAGVTLVGRGGLWLAAL